MKMLVENAVRLSYQFNLLNFGFSIVKSFQTDFIAAFSSTSELNGFPDLSLHTFVFTRSR